MGSRLNQLQNTILASDSVKYENIIGDKYSQKAIIGEFIQRRNIKNKTRLISIESQPKKIVVVAVIGVGLVVVHVVAVVIPV